MKKGSMAVKLGWGVAATLAVALFAHAKTMHGIGEFPLACESVAAVDGRQHGPKVGRGEGESVSQTEEFVLLTTEAKWYRRNDKPVPELEAAASSGDEFLVDYVRVYDIEEAK